ncbi:hypothetical protein SLEP1_g51419 [Rubroshorea leprosula]|uniref:Uncharacterized protein n=1 Tax=Rubroshorea leprosula TaxID=152421 RepID=A0AAV5M3X7_9ROSI|nr:hypothetical protein SLEP1_g51419 [Rubroshorea leprosula]
MEERNREHAAETPSIMQNDNGEHEVDLSHLTSSKAKGFIFRIPGLLKMRNEQAYTPYKFSIGPWHFGKTQLLRTGLKLKESFLEGLINRFPDPATKSRLEEAIKNVHGKARECYEGGDVYDEGDNMGVAKEEFEKILLLDGCFIIELFRKNAEKVSTRSRK